MHAKCAERKKGSSLFICESLVQYESYAARKSLESHFRTETMSNIVLFKQLRSIVDIIDV